MLTSNIIRVENFAHNSVSELIRLEGRGILKTLSFHRLYNASNGLLISVDNGDFVDIGHKGLADYKGASAPAFYNPTLGGMDILNADLWGSINLNIIFNTSLVIKGRASTTMAVLFAIYAMDSVS